MERNPIRPGQHSGMARAALERRTIHNPDVQADPEHTLAAKYVDKTVRTILWVPILKGDNLLGVMTLYHMQVRPFTDKQIALVGTFADQAAIAIENVRLFEAEQQRTRKLSESLEQQTATSGVLQVISRSPGELQPVFDAMLESATGICQAKLGVMELYENGAFRHVAVSGAPSEYIELRQREPYFRPRPEHPLGRIVATRQVVQISDMAGQPEPARGRLTDLAGARTPGHRADAQR